VFAFAESQAPSDDLTCVVIRMAAGDRPQARAHLTVRSELKELSRTRDFVRGFCRSHAGEKLDDESLADVELAVTEACSNIAKHAYHGRNDQPIHIEAESFPDRMTIRLRHLGGPFDPQTVAPPRLDGSQDCGFGVFLIGRCMDGVRYHRDERGSNCITLTKSFLSERSKGDNHGHQR
jgi:anti-sigma regulatory factor (Ser/Thr protein kinase)